MPRAALVSFALLLFAAAADASARTTTEPTTNLCGPVLAIPRSYLVLVSFDDCGDSVCFALVYHESNGIEGSQRLDEVKDDTKGGAGCAPDTLVN